MKESLEEDWLDARLRGEAPYLDDAGFTAQVLRKLPARRARRSLRGVILLGLTVLACVIAYLVSDGGRFVVQGLNRLASLPLPYLCLLAIGCTLLVTLVAAGAAFAQTREETLG